MLQSFFSRKLPKPKATTAVLAGVGGALAITVLIALGHFFEIAMIIAPFGASCVLLFGLPAAPLSQPANVIGGHLVSAVAGMFVLTVFPDFTFYPALGVGLAITGMMLLRVTHPPAGANPVVISILEPNWWFLIAPVLLGSLVLVALAVLFQRAQGVRYPNADPAPTSAPR